VARFYLPPATCCRFKWRKTKDTNKIFAGTASRFRIPLTAGPSKGLESVAPVCQAGLFLVSLSPQIAAALRLQNPRRRLSAHDYFQTNLTAPCAAVAI
jgi:hypothetical protein